MELVKEVLEGSLCFLNLGMQGLKLFTGVTARNIDQALIEVGHNWWGRLFCLGPGKLELRDLSVTLSEEPDLTVTPAAMVQPDRFEDMNALEEFKEFCYKACNIKEKILDIPMIFWIVLGKNLERAVVGELDFETDSGIEKKMSTEKCPMPRSTKSSEEIFLLFNIKGVAKQILFTQ
ncbi:hypothetical protein CPB84DRAFT_1748519 [Gymnopilus junonius]|uniref:Uncharacterized protein n=1 Tax=Gymnopilus junonius TaxID=109634 RepID=A0A9P5TKN4_GYMJU|nr:hypothetical protein CPB84DRAFT_1748519 [Gymnopilus junonius]